MKEKQKIFEEKIRTQQKKKEIVNFYSSNHQIRLPERMVKELSENELQVVLAKKYRRKVVLEAVIKL